jgi:hypothetical protein
VVVLATIGRRSNVCLSARLWTSAGLRHHISALTFHAFFDDKVDAVRGATADASSLLFQSAAIDCQLSSLGIVTIAELITAIVQLPDKQCLSYILPI